MYRPRKLMYCIIYRSPSMISKVFMAHHTTSPPSVYTVLEDTLYITLTPDINVCVDLPSPVSQKSYERIMRKINLASREVADDSMKNAAKEEVSASGSNEICVSGDGTWKTREHTSRIGVCSVIGDVTGKVIDVAVLSSYCKGCEKWRGPKSGHS
ncbi:uncharacterized protein TNCV_638041 [Trichonephila clavipes]|nr:uncharacterized protein TNCV_638041 [Trichonephila clavipes]